MLRRARLKAGAAHGWAVPAFSFSPTIHLMRVGALSKVRSSPMARSITRRKWTYGLGQVRFYPGCPFVRGSGDEDLEVLCWPRNAIGTGLPPLRLRRIRVMLTHKTHADGQRATETRRNRGEMKILHGVALRGIGSEATVHPHRDGMRNFKTRK